MSETVDPAGSRRPARRDREGGAGRGDVGGQLLGAIIAAGFGGLWSVGCASALAAGDRPLAPALAVGGLGVAAALVLVGLALRLRARARAGRPARPNAMLASRGYRVVVAIELVAIVAGGPVLGRLGLGGYAVFWVAFVVGAHFVGFGVMFWRGFHLIGVTMIAGALLGLVLALRLAPAVGGTLTTAVCAVVLLVSAAVSVRYAHRHPPALAADPTASAG